MPYSVAQREYNRRYRAKLRAKPRSEWPEWLREMQDRLPMLDDLRKRKRRQNAQDWKRRGLPKCVQREIALGRAESRWRRNRRRNRAGA